MPHLVNIPKTSAPQETNSFPEPNIPSLEPNSFTCEVMCCLVFCGLCVVFICLFLIPALSDSQSNFLLNGNFVVAMFKREITFKGTVIEYSGSDTKVERINCTDRIEAELVLQVLINREWLIYFLGQFDSFFCDEYYSVSVMLTLISLCKMSNDFSAIFVPTGLVCGEPV